MVENATILQAKEGNWDAFRRLYDEHRERVYGLAYHCMRSFHDSEDVMQETFIKVFKGLGKFKLGVDSSFSAWISKICTHCAIEHLRRRKRQKGKDHLSLNDLTHEPESPDPASDRAVAALQTVAWIQNSMHLLSPGQQILFDMRYRQHLDIKEIARRMDCSESNVKTQLSRSVAILRKLLEPIWGKP